MEQWNIFRIHKNIHSKGENNNNSSYLLIQDICKVRVGPYKISICKNKAKNKKQRQQSHNIHNPGQPEGSGLYDFMIHSYEGDRRTRHVSGHHVVTALVLQLDGDPEKGGLVSSGVPRGAEHCSVTGTERSGSGLGFR